MRKIGYLGGYRLIGPLPGALSQLADVSDEQMGALSIIGDSSGQGFMLASGGRLCGGDCEGAAGLYEGFPAVTAHSLGSESFRQAYRTKYAYYAGAMANGISSVQMVVKLGLAGYMGSFGSGGLSPNEVERAIDQIQLHLKDGGYLINLLHSPDDENREDAMVSLFLEKSVRAIEASAFVDVSPALVRYRLAGCVKNEDGVSCDNHIIAKVSRREVAGKFMTPPDPAIIASLLAKGLITADQAMWAKDIPVADDITIEADSGGHTDNGPLISLLPLIIGIRDEVQRRYGYAQPIRVGAAGGIATPQSAAAAFQMGADYVVTGSVNQSCVEAGTSDYVKDMLARVDMSDVVMAPSADMFESGARVQVIKTGTMYPMNAQKLYDLYTRYSCLEDIPGTDMRAIEKRLFHCDVDTVWTYVEEYFTRVDPHVLRKAETNKKLKMALVFRWYLGNSSRWAIHGDLDRRMDMQIWCGKSMGAFNQWVRGTELESPANRTVVGIADAIMSEAAVITMRNYLQLLGVNWGTRSGYYY